MKKSFLLIGMLSSVVLLSGCGHAVSNYSPSSVNVNLLHGLKQNAKAVNLGKFTDPNNTRALVCRLEGDEKMPDHVTYVSYVKNALKSELSQSGLYSPNSKIKLDATLNRVSFNSVTGSADWKIQMTFNDHIQKPYVIASTYHYSTDIIADVACAQVSHAFAPAVQQFLHTVYQNPHFKKTLQGK